MGLEFMLRIRVMWFGFIDKLSFYDNDLCGYPYYQKEESRGVNCQLS